jgi:hypothetical protein
LLNISPKTDVVQAKFNQKDRPVLGEFLLCGFRLDSGWISAKIGEIAITVYFLYVI